MSEKRIVWGIGTSRTIRAHWALIELGLPYSIEVVRTRTPDTETEEFKSVNPRQKIPVLEDGEIRIGESAAIVTYLAENYRQGSTILIPEDKALRAKYFEWMSFITMELDATSLYVLRRHWSLPEIYGDSPVANKASEDYFQRMITAASKMIDDKKPYLLGNSFTGVDILLTTTLKWAVDYNQKLPAIFNDYLARLNDRPQYIEAQRVNNPT